MRQNDLQQLLHRQQQQQQQQQQQLQQPLRSSIVAPFSQGQGVTNSGQGVTNSGNGGVTDLKSIGFNRKISPFPSSHSATGLNGLNTAHTGLLDALNDPRRRDISYPLSLPTSDHALYASQLQVL